MADLDRWEDEPFTYAEVGATDGPLPSGYHHIEQDTVVGSGAADFARHGDTLMSFGVLRAAGISIYPSAPRAAVGVVVEQRLGIGRVGILAPCRVVRVIDEPRRVGFAYGSIGPHPENGEEEFVLTWADDDSVRFSVRSFSRQGRWFSKLGAPVVRWFQRRYVARFLAALKEVDNRTHPDG